MKKYYLVSLASLLIVSQLGLIHAEEITPKIHSVSSQNPVSGRDAANTINESGLNANGTHSAAEAGVVWTTLGTIGATDFSPFIVYDLGGIQDLAEMHVWNYNCARIVRKKVDNSEASTQERSSSILGAKKVEFLTSVDGKNYQSRGVKNFEMANGTNADKGQRLKLNYKGIRYLKLAIKSSHEGSIFDGSGKVKGDYDGRALTGLSEVKFFVPSIVEFQNTDKKFVLKEGSDRYETYQLRLKKKPMGEKAEVLVVPEDPSLKIGTGSAGESGVFVFEEKNWNQWQTVKVKATDDSIDLVNHKAIVAHFYRNVGSKSVVRLSHEVSIRIEDNDETVVEKLEPIDPAKRMEWFADSKYYWFICWGPCAVGGGEISFSRAGYGPKKYDQFYKKFKGEKFDAEEWVRIAKAGGLKTIVLIAKHHDGFCMWDSKTTDYDIMSTPFGRDMTKELSDACKKHGLRFSLYYSNPDWYHPDWWCPGMGGPGYQLAPKDYGKDEYEYAAGGGAIPSQLLKRQKPNHQRYVDYMNKQAEELLTNYGDISLMWWDGSNPNAFGQTWIKYQEKVGRDLEKLARKWQPAMVQNNRLGWDRKLPGYHGGWFSNDFGDYNSTETGLSTVDINKPWEMTWTLGTQWSWKPNDVYKSKKNQIREYLLKAVGQNGNYLMDVSPDQSGAFEPRVVERITEIGNWLKLNSESIYKTRGGPYLPANPNVPTWGYSTRNGNKVYLHVLNWPSNNQLTFPSLGKKVVKSRVMTGGSVKLTQANADSSITVEVPPHYQKEIDTIIVLELDGDVMKVPVVKLR